MSTKQNQIFRYLRLALVVISYVLYPYFVNQIPDLRDFAQDVPPILIGIGALFFAAIVVLGPELLPEIPSSQQKFWEKNQKRIRKRLKRSFERDYRIPLKGVLISRLSANSQTQQTKLQNIKPIIEIFNQSNRHLLILGKPGSGKTTQLLQLAEMLGNEAKEDLQKPIPVIFELSRWPEKEQDLSKYSIFRLILLRCDRNFQKEPKMLNWMATEIANQYGINHSRCKQWLKEGKIMPLFDGLDELGEQKKEKIVRAIEVLQKSLAEQQNSLVICCNPRDFVNIQGNLEHDIPLKGIEFAADLRELEDSEIEEYLNQRKALYIWKELQIKPKFMELARRPMLLHLMPITYLQLPKKQPQNFEEGQDKIFEDFLCHSLKKIDIKAERARLYLTWLAANMKRKDIEERGFFIEQLQPQWLNNEQQWRQYQMIIGFIFGQVGAFFTTIIFSFLVDIRFGSILGLAIGMIVGVLFGNIKGLIFNLNSIQLIEAFDLSWQGIVRGFINSIIGGTIGGIFGGAIGMVLGSPRKLIFTLVFGILFGLVLGFTQSLKTEIEVRERPNQGVWQTFNPIFVTMFVSSLLFPLVFILPNLIIESKFIWREVLIKGIGLGACLGFFLGGGGPLIQHFSLRLVLFLYNYIPWNYAEFLNTLSELGILHNEGGYYYFYHHELRKYLAKDARNISVSFKPPKAKTNLFLWFPLVIAGLLFLNSFTIVSPQDLESYGLQPILQARDTILTDSLTRQFQRGDVILFKTQEDSTDVKYIIGEPKETIAIASGRIQIDGKEAEFNNVELPEDFTRSAITLTTNQYYAVVTESNYEGSRIGSIVSHENILGKFAFRLYPFQRFGFVR